MRNISIFGLDQRLTGKPPRSHDVAVVGVVNVEVQRGFVRITWKLPKFNQRQRRTHVHMIAPTSEMPEIVAALINAMQGGRTGVQH